MNRALGMALAALYSLIVVSTVWAQEAPSPPLQEESAERIEQLSERGPVTVHISLEPVQPLIGDPLTLTLEATAEPGVELICARESTVELWDALVAAGGRPVGLAARDSLRLEKGLWLSGQDFTEACNPYEAGLGWVIKLDKASFHGKAALEAIKAQGVQRRLVALRGCTPLFAASNSSPRLASLLPGLMLSTRSRHCLLRSRSSTAEANHNHACSLRGSALMTWASSRLPVSLSPALTAAMPCCNRPSIARPFHRSARRTLTVGGLGAGMFATTASSTALRVTE